jgi:hypothetical protein
MYIPTTLALYVDEKPGANPTTSEFAITTLTLWYLGRLERFPKEEHVFFSKRTRLLLPFKIFPRS